MTKRRMKPIHLWTPLMELVERARRRSRDREALARMDDRELSDLRMSRATVAYELSKPFWRD